MAIILLTVALGVLYLIAILLSKAIFPEPKPKNTFFIWLIMSFIVVLFYGFLVTENARWAKKQCTDKSGYSIKKTVNADGFYARSTSAYDYIPYLVNENYKYIELIKPQGYKNVKLIYISDITNANCQNEYFENKNMGMNSLLRKLPTPPIPDNMCVAIENTDKVKSRYMFDKGNIKWISGKGTTLHKIIDTTNDEIISSWIGFIGRGYFKTYECTTPQNGSLIERTIKPNKLVQSPF